MLLLGSLEKGTPEDFMAVSVAFVKLATLGVGALLGQGYDVKALATVSVPMGELVDIVFHGFDVAKRRRLRSLCDCLAAELATRIRGRDPGTVTSARLEAEHLLASFGLREERLVELGLDARLAAGELLCQASFTADEKAEIEPLCEELLVCFYERLKDQHEFIQDLLPNIYGELLRDTKAIRGDVQAVRDDLGAIRDLLARPAEARLAKALPETRLLHGRDAELSTLLAMLLDADRRPVLVHGGPGMGKTALTVAALHDAAVVERFGERRFFADLDEVRTGEGVLDRVAASMGEAEGQGGATRALRALAAEPALLVLDNLETPWEGQGPETGRALAQLAALPGLQLLASIRGDEKPGQIRWRRLDEMAPLDDGQARTLFLDVSEGFGAADPDLGRLLALLGGVPLAIDLVARRVEETGVASLVADWRQRRTRAAARGAANDRELSLHVSIELSLASPRLGGSSRRLFAMLGQLPGGLDPGDAEALLAEPGLAAMAGLRHAGLARIEAGRLRMLPPIREHALDTPPEPGDRQRLQDHFLGLARALDRLESGSDRTADVGRLRAELVNVEAVLEQLMTAEPEPADGSYTGRELAWLSLAVGTCAPGSASSLRHLPRSNARMASSRKRPRARH